MYLGDLHVCNFEKGLQLDLIDMRVYGLSERDNPWAHYI
jgi:hypothetical protein